MTGSTSGPLLEVRDLRTHFQTRDALVKAVDGVSFTVDRGEVLGIVGESGSGKSVTAMSILQLVAKPAGRIVGGEILLDGRNLLELSEREMRSVRGEQIAMILQDPMASLDPVFTVEAQIAETMRAHGVGDSDTISQRVIELLKLVQISAPDARAQSYPHQLSGGIRQRIVAAIAISCGASLLIADEPTTALDVTIQWQFLDTLKRLQREADIGMIFITHDLGVVANVCDRVAVMYAGRIVEMADVKTLFAAPEHPYTRALLESLPKLAERRERLPAISGQPPDPGQKPPGCPFNPRCPSRIGEICDTEYPPTVRLDEGGHTVNCWLHEESV